MNNTQAVLSSIDALLRTTVKLADHHDLNEIRISKARAKELLTQISIAKKETERPRQVTPRFHRHLDTVFNV
jgi:hypothetical protein